MRVSILILLVIGFAFGQDAEFTVDRKVYPELFTMGNKDYRCWDENDIITLKDILDYAEECYNDSVYKGKMYIISESFYPDSSFSTMLTATFRFDDETYYRDRPNEYIRIEEIYEPKIPTFQGFIEWIEKNEIYRSK